MSHGYGTALPDPVQHLRDYRAAAGAIWVLDPRRTESAALADEHLADAARDRRRRAGGAGARAARPTAPTPTSCATTARPTTSTRSARALAPFTVARGRGRAGIDAGALDALVADVRAHRGRLAVMCGTGATMATDGILVEWLRWVLLILTGSLDRPGGMRFHRGDAEPAAPAARAAGRRAAGPASRPELPRVVGQIPAVALADEIEAGNVRALVVTGGNPITAFPEPDRLRAALRSLDALVVVDVVESELTALATHVLPATGQLERADITLDAHIVGAVRRCRRPARSSRRSPNGGPVWWMFGHAGRVAWASTCSAAPIPTTSPTRRYLRGIARALAARRRRGVRRRPHGLDVPVEYGWVHETMLPDGRWQIAPAVLLERLAAHREPGARASCSSPRREMAWSNSVRYGADDDRARLRVHPRRRRSTRAWSTGRRRPSSASTARST